MMTVYTVNLYYMYSTEQYCMSIWYGWHWLNMNVMDVDRILKVAQTFADSNVTFAMSSAQDFEQELAELGVTVDPTQPAVIGRYNANQSYVMNEDFS